MTSTRESENSKRYTNSYNVPPLVALCNLASNSHRSRLASFAASRRKSSQPPTPRLSYRQGMTRARAHARVRIMCVCAKRSRDQERARRSRDMNGERARDRRFYVCSTTTTGSPTTPTDILCARSYIARDCPTSARFWLVPIRPV